MSLYESLILLDSFRQTSLPTAPGGVEALWRENTGRYRGDGRAGSASSVVLDFNYLDESITLGTSSILVSSRQEAQTSGSNTVH